MTVFQNKEQMQTVLGGLFEKLLSDPTLGLKFNKAGITIKYNVSEPDGIIWVVPGNGDKGEVLLGKADIKADVEMTLSGDTCHKFWLKQISMPVALAKGLIKSKGPLPKVLKLLPLLKPAFEAYPEHAKFHGLSIEEESFKQQKE